MLRRFIILFLGFPLAAASAAQQGTLSNFAGTGVKGFSGDGGPATKAQLNDPTGLTFGEDRSIYICDTGNHRIRKVTADGRISTVAGTGEAGWSGDGGPATAAKLNEPYEVRIDPAGDLFWVERLSHSVRKRDARTGRISTVAGNGTAGFSGDDAAASRAQLNDPHSIGFDRGGNLYICDVKNHRIRKVDMKTGVISTFAGNGDRKALESSGPIAGAPLFGPRALDFDKQGNLWLALREGNAIFKLDLAAGKIQRMAGTGKKGFTGNDGPALEATFAGPKGISVGAGGQVYIADTENHCVRMIDPSSGTLKLVVGTGSRGPGEDADPLRCALTRPHGVLVGSEGQLYIGDSEAHRVRLVRFVK